MVELVLVLLEVVKARVVVLEMGVVVTLHDVSSHSEGCGPQFMMLLYSGGFS